MKKIYKIIFLLLFFQNFSEAEINNKQEVDKISKNLRCLICQGQSVYDSQSEFALSIKTLIDFQLDQGKNEEQIYTYLKEKYGVWITYDPELNTNTILLWLIPLILFVFGGILIIKKLSINSLKKK
tara:strand:+ start:2654 stop:3031 length:378 start_codon:yes stop_codon:yes gene_type:complete